jgi:hypothetical protein
MECFIFLCWYVHKKLLKHAIQWHYYWALALNSSTVWVGTSLRVKGVRLMIYTAKHLLWDLCCVIVVWRNESIKCIVYGFSLDSSWNLGERNSLLMLPWQTAYYYWSLTVLTYRDTVSVSRTHTCKGCSNCISEQKLNTGYSPVICDLLGCDAIQSCRWLPMFWRNASPQFSVFMPTSALKILCDMFLQNFCNHLKTVWCDSQEDHTQHPHSSEHFISHFLHHWDVFFKVLQFYMQVKTSHILHFNQSICINY